MKKNLMSILILALLVVNGYYDVQRNRGNEEYYGTGG